MGVLREFLCHGHGSFESDEPVCPHGCTLVEREFLTAPGYVGGRTKATDRAFEDVARQYGLTDMNNRDGKAARVVPVAQGEARAQQVSYSDFLKKRFAAQSVVPTRDGLGAWGNVAPGGTYHLGGKVEGAERGGGAPASTRAVGAPEENRWQEVKEASPPRKAVVGKRDPQNLQVAV